MNPKQKRNLAIGGAVIITGTIAYLIYRSKQNEKEGTALLAYIDKSYSQVNLSAAADQAAEETRNVKVDWNKVKIDNLYGNPQKVAAIKNQLAKVETELWAAMKGAGTNVDALVKQLSRIKNKNTLAIVDKFFDIKFGTGLFEWMKDEKLLNNPLYGLYSDKTSGIMNFIPFSEGYWHPKVANYLKSIPDY